MGRQFCGIDISDHTIEIISMVNRSQGPKVVMAARAELPSGVVSRGVIQDPEALGALLGDYLDRVFGKRRHVVAGISVPEIQVYARTLEIPEDTESNLVENMILDLASGLMPIDISTSEVSIREMESFGSEKRFFCAAVERNVLEGYRQAMEIADVDVQFFEMESSALSRAVVGTDQPVMLVDMGARTTLVTIIGRRMRLSTNPMVGGDDLTKALEEKLQISYVRAEQMKRREGLDPDRGDGRTMLILQKPLSELVSELGRTIDFFEKEVQRSVAEVILVGGTSMVPGIVSYIQDNFRIKKVYQGQPFRGLTMGEFPNSVKVIDQHIFYATAIGLALRVCGAVEDDSIDFNVEAAHVGGFKSLINKLLQAVKLPTMPTKSTKSAGSKMSKKRAPKSSSKAKSTRAKRKPAKKVAKAKKQKPEIKSVDNNDELMSQAPSEVDEALATSEQVRLGGGVSLPADMGMNIQPEEEETPLPPVVPHELPAIDSQKSDELSAENVITAEETPGLVDAEESSLTDVADDKPVAGEQPAGPGAASVEEEPAEERSFNDVPMLGEGTVGDDATDEKDYGLGIGDILSQDEETKLQPAELGDDAMAQAGESMDDSVHRLKIEEILGHIDTAKEEPLRETASMPESRIKTRRPRRRNNVTLVILIILLFASASIGIFMFVSKNGLWFMSDKGQKQEVSNQMTDVAPEPSGVESVAANLLLTTNAEDVAEGREPVVSRVIETDVTGSADFEATGEVPAPAQDDEGPVRATGTITVINDAGREFTFVATTRFLSEDGMLFRMKNRSVIPEGESEVEVYADVAGPAGNIAPTTFIIPGLSAELQKQVTGRSETFMGGGSDGNEAGEMVTAVSQDDLDSVRDKISAELMDEAKSNFSVMLSDEEMVHEDLITGSDIEVQAPAVGTIGEKFTYKLTQRYRSFLIPNSQVMDILQKELVKSLPEDGSSAGYSVGKPVFVVEAYDEASGLVELRVEAPVLSE